MPLRPFFFHPPESYYRSLCSAPPLGRIIEFFIFFLLEFITLSTSLTYSSGGLAWIGLLLSCFKIDETEGGLGFISYFSSLHKYFLSLERVEQNKRRKDTEWQNGSRANQDSKVVGDLPLCIIPSFFVCTINQNILIPQFLYLMLIY